MARRFNGTSDYVVFTLPATLEAVHAGDMTMVFVANFTDATDGAMVHARTSGGTNCWWMETFTEWNYGQGGTAKDVGDITTGSWAAYIGRKVTGGANAPRGRKIIFGGATTDVTAGSGLADGSVPGAGGILQVGKWGTASEFISADVAAVAVFASDLSDATTATFTTWQAILDAGPAWAVHFDQASATDAITDATGNGGNSSTITGTTIVANPSGFFAAGDVTGTGAAGLGVRRADRRSRGSERHRRCRRSRPRRADRHRDRYAIGRRRRRHGHGRPWRARRGGVRTADHRRRRRGVARRVDGCGGTCPHGDARYCARPDGARCRSGDRAY